MGCVLMLEATGLPAKWGAQECGILSRPPACTQTEHETYNKHTHSTAVVIAGEILRCLKTFAAGVHDRDALMGRAFKGIGGLPGAKVAQLQALEARKVGGVCWCLLVLVKCGIH